MIGNSVFRDAFKTLFDEWESLTQFQIPKEVFENKKSIGFYYQTWSGAIVWEMNKRNEYTAYCALYHRFINDRFYKISSKGEITEPSYPIDFLSNNTEKIRKKHAQFFHCQDIIENVSQRCIKEQLYDKEALEKGILQFWEIVD
jgi:hypothetical protein